MGIKTLNEKEFQSDYYEQIYKTKKIRYRKIILNTHPIKIHLSHLSLVN